MPRSFVPFDNSWRMPIPIAVSRAVRDGDLVFTCGQADLDAHGNPQRTGDLRAQTAHAMQHVYSVLDKAAAAPGDVLQLHVFYRNDGSVDEAPYLDSLLALIPAAAPPLIELTPLPVLFYPGVEVEIDAIAVAGAGAAGGIRRMGDGVTPLGIRCGDIALVQASGITAGAAGVAAAARGAVATVVEVLRELGADATDVCRLRVYATGESGDRDAARAMLGETFAGARPTCTEVPMARLGRPGEAVRIEGFAVCSGGVRRHYGNAAAPFAAGVGAGRMLFIGGHKALDESQRVMSPGDLAAQTHAVMRAIGAVLATAGAGFAQLAKVNTFYAGADRGEDLHTNLLIRSGYYAKPGPASTGMPVPRLDPAGTMISVDAVAVLD